MAGIVDTAYVRLRPDAHGFQQEAEAGIKSGLRNIRNIVGGAFAAAGVFEAGKAIVEAAAEHQSAFAVVDQTLKNAHQATDLYGVSVESLIEKEARLKGFHDEDLASSFVRLVSATGDSAQAFKDLGLAEDVARARHIDVAVAALALSRAEQGSTQSLSRLGVVIPKVNEAQAELKKRHDEAVASGAKFNAQQKLIYQDALAQAGAQDRVANRLHALSVVQQRFGDSASEFAKTSSGQFQRTEQDIHQFEVAVGRDALPAINTLAEGVGKYAVELTHSQSVQDAVKGGMRDLSVFGRDLKDVVETVGPTFLSIATGAERAASAIGAPAIIAAVGTYKALGVAQGIVAAGEAAYARVLATGSAVKAADVTETAALTAALTANTEAIAANRLAAAAGITENVALGASQVALAGTSEAAAAGGIATFARGIGQLGLAAVGGPTGLAVAGIAALAGTFVYLGTRESDTERATDQLRAAFDLLGGSLNKTRELAQNLAQTRIDAALARDAKAAADAAVQQAQATEVATRGTAQHAAAVLALRTARDQDRASALAVTQAEERQKQAAGAATTNEREIAQQRRASTDAAVKLAQSEHDLDSIRARQKLGIANQLGAPGQQLIAGQTATNDAAASAEFIRKVADEAGKLQAKNPGLATSLRLLEQFARDIGTLPTKREIQFILDPKNAKQSLNVIERELLQGHALDQAARKGGHDIGASLSDGVRSGIEDTQAKVSAGIARSVRETVQAGKAAAEARSPSLVTAREIGLPLAQGIAVGINTGAPDVQRALADTVGQAISQGGQQVADAINQAKQNLNTIGQGLASTIGQFIDAGPLGAEIKRLQDSLSRRQNAAQETQLRQGVAAARKALRDAQEAVGPTSSQTPAERRALNQFLAPQRDAVEQAEAALADFHTQRRIDSLQGRETALKNATTRGIADLTDEFNKGQISAHRFNVGLAAILAKDDIDYRRAGKVLGVAYADGFEAQLGGLRDQVEALVGAPHLPGAGLAPSIVRPIQTLQEVTRQVAQAAKDQRAQQIAEAKTANKHLAALDAAAKAAAFTKSLGLPGPTADARGKATRRK